MLLSRRRWVLEVVPAHRQTLANPAAVKGPQNLNVADVKLVMDFHEARSRDSAFANTMINQFHGRRRTADDA